MRIHFVSCSTTFLLISAFAAIIPAHAGEKQSNTATDRRTLAQWKAGEGEIRFYGKVVDQTGAPVVGATIGIDVPEQTGFMQRASRKQTVMTDENGCFDIASKTYGLKELRGSFLFIESIDKNGYEYTRDTNLKTSFIYRREDTDCHVPKKGQPVVFKMRKIKASPTFLCQEMYLGLETRVNMSGNSIGYDFIRHHRINDTHNLVYDGGSLSPDLLVKATFNTNDATWAVVLSPGGTKGGIIVSEQLLYEAPDSGYQPEYTFTPQDHKTPQAKYIYIRSRDPAIYSRYEIEYINANKDFFRLSGKSMTNPYGERNLEQATDLPYEITKRLADETKAAFRQDKRPGKPDIQKLTDEAKGRADTNMH